MKINRMIKNILIIISGNAGAQLITMLSMPILTRLYGPSNIGLANYYISILTIVSPIVALTYQMAIVLPRNNAEAKMISRVSIYLSFLFFVFFMCFLFLFKDGVSNFFKLESIIDYIYLLPFSLLFISLFQIYTQWAIRRGMFSSIAKASIIQSVFLNVTKITFGLLFPTGMVLVIITFLGNMTQSITLGFRVLKDWANTYKLSITKVRFLYFLKKYHDFPVFRLPQVLINSFTQNMPIILLGAYFDLSVVGYFSIAKLAVSVPVTLIAQSISNVFYPQITDEINKKNNYFNTLSRLTMYLFSFSIIPFLLVAFFAGEIFSIVFGYEWVVAGDFCFYLSIWYFFVFISRPCVTAIPALKLQKWFLYYEIFGLIMRVGSVFFAIFIFHDEMIMIAFLSIINSFLYAGLVFYILYFSRRKAKDDIKY